MGPAELELLFPEQCHGKSEHVQVVLRTNDWERSWAELGPDRDSLDCFVERVLFDYRTLFAMELCQAAVSCQDARCSIFHLETEIRRLLIEKSMIIVVLVVLM